MPAVGLNCFTVGQGGKLVARRHADVRPDSTPARLRPVPRPSVPVPRDVHVHVHAQRSSASPCSRASSSPRWVSRAVAPHAGVYDSDGPGRLGWTPFDSERFRFQTVLGRGGWGQVYLAEDRASGREVAIKVQSKWPRQEAGKRMPSQAAVLAHIRNEGDMWKLMQCSPRVVRLLERCEDKDNAYFVSEVMHGGDLEQLFASRSRLSEQHAAQLVRGVLAVLRDCHLNGVAFSDVKPANFMLNVEEDGTETVKVIDFGCAQECDKGQELNKRVGTPMFFAPEMFNRCYGMEADVWSVGIMMYRFISGRFPWFEGEPGRVAPGQIMSAVLSDPIPMDAPVWRYKTDACRDLLRRLLQRDPKKRIPIADALQHPWLRMHCGDDEDEPCVVVDEEEEEEGVKALAHIPPGVVMSNVVSLYSKQTAAQAAKSAAATSSPPP